MLAATPKAIPGSRRTLRACWLLHDPARQAIALGASGAVAALLLHSLTDFNLYVPANGLVFAVVLGLGSGVSATAAALPKERLLA